jgi:hypothetical protein
MKKRNIFLAGAVTGVIAANAGLKTIGKLPEQVGSPGGLCMLASSTAFNIGSFLVRPFWLDIDWDSELQREVAQTHVN